MLQGSLIGGYGCKPGSPMQTISIWAAIAVAANQRTGRSTTATQSRTYLRSQVNKQAEAKEHSSVPKRRQKRPDSHSDSFSSGPFTVPTTVSDFYVCRLEYRTSNNGMFYNKSPSQGAMAKNYSTGSKAMKLSNTISTLHHFTAPRAFT